MAQNDSILLKWNVTTYLDVDPWVNGYLQNWTNRLPHYTLKPLIYPNVNNPDLAHVLHHLQRVETLGSNNDCLIHSFLTNVSATYRKSSDAEKTKVAKYFRRTIMVNVATEFIKNPDRDSKTTVTAEMVKELKGTGFLSDLHVGLLADHFKINIFVKDENIFGWTLSSPYVDSSFVKKKETSIYRTILIYNPGQNHFEAVTSPPHNRNDWANYTFIFEPNNYIIRLLEEEGQQVYQQDISHTARPKTGSKNSVGHKKNNDIDELNLFDCPFNRCFVKDGDSNYYMVFNQGENSQKQCAYMYAVPLRTLVKEVQSDSQPAATNMIMEQALKRKIKDYLNFNVAQVKQLLREHSIIDINQHKSWFQFVAQFNDEAHIPLNAEVMENVNYLSAAPSKSAFNFENMSTRTQQHNAFQRTMPSYTVPPYRAERTVPPYRAERTVPPYRAERTVPPYRAERTVSYRAERTVPPYRAVNTSRRNRPYRNTVFNANRPFRQRTRRNFNNQRPMTQRQKLLRLLQQLYQRQQQPRNRKTVRGNVYHMY